MNYKWITKLDIRDVAKTEANFIAVPIIFSVYKNNIFSFCCKIRFAFINQIL